MTEGDGRVSFPREHSAARPLLHLSEPRKKSPSKRPFPDGHGKGLSKHQARQGQETPKGWSSLHLPGQPSFLTQGLSPLVETRLSPQPQPQRGCLSGQWLKVVSLFSPGRTCSPGAPVGWEWPLSTILISGAAGEACAHTVLHPGQSVPLATYRNSKKTKQSTTINSLPASAPRSLNPIAILEARHRLKQKPH